MSFPHHPELTRTVSIESEAEEATERQHLLAQDAIPEEDEDQRAGDSGVSGSPVEHEIPEGMTPETLIGAFGYDFYLRTLGQNMDFHRDIVMNNFFWILLHFRVCLIIGI